MRKPKSQTVAAEHLPPTEAPAAPPPPGRRDGANVKPRPRPQRPALLREAQAAASAPAYTPAEVEEIFRRLKVQRPEPKGELVSVNPFTLLVAVALSAQATDKSVNQATETLFQVADTPEKMLALGEERLGEYIRTIGLWRAKAKNVIALSEALIRDHEGQVPADMEALMKLPGVGRKTANVVLNTAFGQPTLAVDTHIFRIGNRLGLGPGKTPDQVEQALLKIIPEGYRKGAHHWLLLHGRYVCKARRPECEACVIADLCKAREKTSSVPAPLEPIG